MQAPRAIVFDFDGVLVESNEVKHRTFQEIFLEYPKKYDEIMAYHLANNAIDRFKKFHHIAQNILMIKESRDLEKTWATRFQKRTREEILKASSVEGSLEMLNYFMDRVPMYLASATPDEEILFLVRARSLEKFFKKIYGSKTAKSHALFEIIQQGGGKNAKEVLFIGDSPEDYKSGEEAGVTFIGRVSSHNFRSKVSFNNLNEILEYIKRGVFL